MYMRKILHKNTFVNKGEKMFYITWAYQIFPQYILLKNAHILKRDRTLITERQVLTNFQWFFSLSLLSAKIKKKQNKNEKQNQLLKPQPISYTQDGSL